MSRIVLLLTLLAALAAAGCNEDDEKVVALSDAEACKAVKEKLNVEQIEDRFGKPDQTQDFFGDTVVAYDRDEVRWQFQVSAQSGTFRAMRVTGSREEIVECPA